MALKNRVATTKTRLPRICSLTQLLLVDHMDEKKIAKRRTHGMQPIDSCFGGLLHLDRFPLVIIIAIGLIGLSCNH